MITILQKMNSRWPRLVWGILAVGTGELFQISYGRLLELAYPILQLFDARYHED